MRFFFCHRKSDSRALSMARKIINAVAVVAATCYKITGATKTEKSQYGVVY